MGRTILLAFLMVQAGFSAIVYKGSVSGGGSSGSIQNWPSTTSITVAAGDLIVVCSAAVPGTGTMTVLDDASNTYTDLTVYARNGSGLNGQCHYARNSAALSNNFITLHTSSTGSFTAFIAAVFSGTDTTAPLDVSIGCGAACSGNNTTPVSASFSTSTANEVIVTGLFAGGQGTVTGGSGYTFIGMDAPVSEVGMEYKIVSTTQSSVTAGFTMATGVPWGVAVQSFKAIGATVSAVKHRVISQ